MTMQIAVQRKWIHWRSNPKATRNPTPKKIMVAPDTSAHVASIWLKVKGVSTDGLSEFVADTFFRYEQKKKT